MNYSSTIKNKYVVGDEKKSAPTVICLDCDLLVTVPLKNIAEKIICPRCDHLLLSHRTNSLNRLISLSLSSLIFFILSLCFPFMSYDAGGSERAISLIESVTTLASLDYLLLAGLIATVILLVPALFLCALLYILLPLKLGKKAVYSPVVLKLSLAMLPWSMVEIFLISVLVSIIKLTSSADIGLGLSFYAFALFSLFLSATILSLDVHQIWDWLDTPEYPNTGIRGNALSQRLTACPVCHCTVPLSHSYCQRCGTTISARKSHSIQKTLAYLSVAMMLYIPANIMPIMQTRLFGKDQFNTILGGIHVLWIHGSYPIAIIIFIASIVVPIAKMTALSWLSFSVKYNKHNRLREKTLLYRMTDFVGRWSMLDVFVVAILTGLIHQGKILAIYPGPAIVAFAGVVIFTLLAAMNFDPRLLWDKMEYNK